MGMKRLFSLLEGRGDREWLEKAISFEVFSAGVGDIPDKKAAYQDFLAYKSDATVPAEHFENWLEFRGSKFGVD